MLIRSSYGDENAGSIALLESLGFRREGFLPERWFVNGQWRHSVILGLLKQDWQKKRAP
jgi:RimJ/RimL family protein N-acetyltransferase